MKAPIPILILLALLAGLATNFGQADELAPLLKTILNVGPEGRGHQAAATAWRKLAEADASELPDLLAALDEANPLAANWLRSAAETIADRQLDRRNKLPVEALENFVLDVRHQPRARRLAFELLTRTDAKAPDRLIPGMLDDPASEFRREAVQRLVDEGARLKTGRTSGDALPVYLNALSGARDADQVEAIADALESLGRPFDLAAHFGFITNWNLIGPFDNTAGKGFVTSYPPERKIALVASYPGKSADVEWIRHVTKDNCGVVDLVKALGSGSGAVAYAATEFSLDAGRSVEFRITTSNAWKLWVNGEFVSQCDEYHRFMEPDRDEFKTFLKPQFDKFRMKAELKKGKNTILLKVCQNERVEDWAQRWQFQLRVCDRVGTAVLSTTRPAAAAPASPPQAAGN